MKTRLAIAIVLALAASSARAEMLRFSGGGTGGPGYSVPYDGTLTIDGEYSGTINKALYEPTWTVDVSTDGQSLELHSVTVEWSGHVEINSFVSFDIEVSASLPPQTLDINPTTTTLWAVEPLSIPPSSLSVSGTYFGLGYTQEFSGTLPFNASYWNKYWRIEFDDWPNQLDWNPSDNATATGGWRWHADKNSGWIGVEPFLHISDFQLYRPLSVDLQLVSSTGDFDGNATIDGMDLLAWQRGESPDPWSSADLTTWENAYGTAPAQSSSSIPEPSTIVLLLLAAWWPQRLR